KPWPGTRIRVVMGTLKLIKVAEDQDADGERISFNPCRLAPGIEVSKDPILEARLGAYEVSREVRGGGPFKWRQGDGKERRFARSFCELVTHEPRVQARGVTDSGAFLGVADAGEASARWSPPVVPAR